MLPYCKYRWSDAKHRENILDSGYISALLIFVLIKLSEQHELVQNLFNLEKTIQKMSAHDK